MDWVLSGLVVLGNWMIGQKLKWGWVVMSINSVAWIYYAVWYLDPIQWGLVPSAALNFVVAVRSAVKWFRDEARNQRILDDRGLL